MRKIMMISGCIGNKSSRIIYNEMKRLEIGDSLLLGAYYLPGNCYPNDCKIKSPIIWQILDKDHDRLLLLSRYMLYWNFFDGSGTLFSPPPKTTWERSSIRSELNGECLNSWFSVEEQAIIMETVHLMDENPQYHTPSGNATVDRLFLLSLEEVNRYLGVSLNPQAESERNCDDTAAFTYMIMADPSLEKDKNEVEVFPQSFSWWLRTSGIDTAYVSCINELGYADLEGIASDADEVGIRPAMWIDLSRLTSGGEDLADENENDWCPFC